MWQTHSSVLPLSPPCYLFADLCLEEKCLSCLEAKIYTGCNSNLGTYNATLFTISNLWLWCCHGVWLPAMEVEAFSKFMNASVLSQLEVGLSDVPFQRLLQMQPRRTAWIGRIRPGHLSSLQDVTINSGSVSLLKPLAVSVSGLVSCTRQCNCKASLSVYR